MNHQYLSCNIFILETLSQTELIVILIIAMLIKLQNKA